MTGRCAVKLTANFERNLEELEAFLTDGGLPQAFDGLLDELIETIIPNLERFPTMGRRFLERPARSVEVANGIGRLSKQLHVLPEDGDVREYVMTHYLLLYVHIEDSVYLLSVRHHRQLSFDLAGHWPE
ncbi:hypothetical protein C6T69_05505 [Burkholderia multivorans]|uniref:type II toxin-antitoxin system RelE/ParE family toxin n=1 Tax=Burkholderia multivorans TaxID=87883 RepID=UPI000CFE9CFD|nr:type II toxin-antitoxin system RelE/ParE family toxin [Burkholderia multivorans]PRG77502.1 hypothetical protein C6T69_05505 [Burkholderia multivorans]